MSSLDLERDAAEGCSTGCCQPEPPGRLTQRQRVGESSCTDANSVKSFGGEEEQCSSGCCERPVQSTAVHEAVTDCCADGPSVTRPTSTSREKLEANCCDGGSYGNADGAPVEDCADQCCSTEPAKVEKSEECKDACCSSTTTTTSGKEKCCDDKATGSCCDEECIDRLVARECERECPKTGKSCQEAQSCSLASSKEKADRCPNGVTARQMYREILRNLGCLCRMLEARDEATCCTSTTRKSSTPRARLQRNRSRRSTRETVRRSSLEITTCGGDDNDCCAEKIPGSALEKEKLSVVAVEDVPSITPLNLEDGIAENGHVVLSVSGMTCVGCETKLQRSIATIKAIKNLKTSLVLCRAEFDLDQRYESVGSIISQLQKMTEFKYEEIKQDCSEIEVCLADVKTFLSQDLPVGVLSLKAVDKTSVRITYDPTVVGARDLVERGFGSSLSIAPVKPEPGLAAGSKHVRHVGLMTLLSATLTIPVLILAWAPIPEKPILYGSVSLALATLVQFVVAGPFYPTALKSLIFAKMIEMDLLIVLSTSAAYIFSVVSFAHTAAGTPLATGEFFETSTLLVTLIMTGRWISALARQKAVESVSMRSLQTQTAVLVDEHDQSTREIDTRLLQYGDVFQVAPESHIPTDGTVIAGHSEIDESMITGESLPVDKQPGKVVIAGSVNGSGSLTVRLSRLPGSNTISAIANMIDEAKLTKPKIQAVADKVASYFIPTAIILALVVFIIWIPIGLKVRQYDGSRATTEALTYAITVIIVSCPCAIGLAVPMVIVVAGGVAAKNGCVFKTASTIEIARKTSHVVFDKTGTLTQGQLAVAVGRYFGDTQSAVTAVHALVSNNKHPVSLAVTKHLESKFDAKQEAVNVTSHVGKGVDGNVDGKVVKVGNSRWLGLEGHPTVREFLSHGYTTLCATLDGELVAVFGLQDSLRPDARKTVAELRRRNIEVTIVSGDDEAPVSAVARQLGITSIRSRCTPANKFEFVKSLTDAGKFAIFCGDGTNDAAALAQATIGVHMNEGTDVAQSAADVVLVRSSLIDILTLIDLSKASMRRIAFNFGWSFVYNTVAILFASGALVNARIPPQYAGLGELVSVLPVIAIAMQLRWAKFSKIPKTE